MAAPPPPPPPPPPGPINAGKPDNKKLLDSICKGASLKKVPDSMKNDRSEVALTKPQGSGNSKNNSGPLLPPSNKPMTLAEEINARKNKKVSQTAPQVSPIPPNEELHARKFPKPTVQQPPSQGLPIPPSNKPLTFNDELTTTKNPKATHFQSALQTNPKRGGAPLPNSLPAQFVPPPPSASNKPMSIAQPPAPIRMPSNLPPHPHPAFNCAVQPPPPHQTFNCAVQPPPPHQTFNSTLQPPPPPPKDLKPNFRQPIPIRSKPTINDDSQIRGIQPNQICGPIIPPPPPMLPPSDVVRPPRFGPPPPPPPSTMPNSFSKPDAPMRSDSGYIKCDFDSRFTFLDMKYFPDPNTMIKMRQT